MQRRSSIASASPGMLAVVNIPASYQLSMKVPGTREQISQACAEAVTTEDQVDITSESINGFTVIDFGKNRWNVNRIFAHLTSLLGVGV